MDVKRGFMRGSRPTSSVQPRHFITGFAGSATDTSPGVHTAAFRVKGAPFRFLASHLVLATIRSHAAGREGLQGKHDI